MYPSILSDRVGICLSDFPEDIVSEIRKCLKERRPVFLKIIQREEVVEHSCSNKP